MRLFAFLILLLTSTVLSAHGSHGSGIMAGLTHPIFGLDHLAAILCMGMYTKIKFRDNAWPIIFSFVGAMIIGGLLGINSLPFPLEETVIKGSILVYGSLLLFLPSINRNLFIGLGVVFGLFHGHAHGVEMPDTTEVYQYVPGFAIGATIIGSFGEYIGRHLGPEQKNIAKGFGVIAILFSIYQFVG